MENPTPKKVYVPVRIDPNTLALLKALAEKDPEASVSSIIRQMIRAGLAQEVK